MYWFYCVSNILRLYDVSKRSFLSFLYIWYDQITKLQAAIKYGEEDLPGAKVCISLVLKRRLSSWKDEHKICDLYLSLYASVEESHRKICPWRYISSNAHIFLIWQVTAKGSIDRNFLATFVAKTWNTSVRWKLSCSLDIHELLCTWYCHNTL